MTVHADTLASPPDPHPTPGPARLPIPDPDQVDAALALVDAVYGAADERHREVFRGATTAVLAAEVVRLRTLDELRSRYVGLAVGRPTAAALGHALAAAEQSEQHPAGSNLRVLAGEVRALWAAWPDVHTLLAELARLRGIKAAASGLRADVAAADDAELRRRFDALHDTLDGA